MSAAADQEQFALLLQEPLGKGVHSEESANDNSMGARAGSKCASSIGGGHGDRFLGDGIRCEFARGITQVKLDTAREEFGNAQALAFAGQEEAGLILAEFESLVDFADGDDGRGAGSQGGHHRAGGPEDIEHDADGLLQIALGQQGVFGWSKKDCGIHQEWFAFGF